MVSILCFLLVAASGLLSPPKNAVSQYEQDYESQYQNDLKTRMAKVDREEDSQVRQSPDGEDGATDDGAGTTDGATDGDNTTVDEAHKSSSSAHAPKVHEDADSAATDQELAEHHKELNHLLAESLEKLKASSKMMVVLHVLMKPVAEKLKVSMEKMPAAAKARSMEILHHIEALDELSQKSVGMLSDVSKVEEGSDAERAAGVKHLMTEMQEIQDGVKIHLAAMKDLPHEDHADAEPAPEESQAPALREPRKLQPMTKKLHALLAKMKTKVEKELADPALKDDPKTAVDVQMYDVMSHSIKRSEALIVVASMLLKKADTPEAKQKIKVAVQEEMHNTMLGLKADMKHLKEKTVMLAAIKEMKAQAAKHGLPTEVHDPEADEEPSAPSHDRHEKEHSAPSQNRHEEEEDWFIPHHRASEAQGSESDETSDAPEEKKSDTPIGQDAPEKKKSDSPVDQDVPEEEKSDEPTDKKSDEPADKDDEAMSDPGQSSFMKKLEEDLKKFHDIHAGIGKDKKDDKKSGPAEGMNDDSDAQADQKDRNSAPEEAADGMKDGSDAPADQKDRDSAPEETVTDDAEEPSADEAPPRQSRTMPNDASADDANDASEPKEEEKEHPPPHASKKHSDRKFKALLDELDDLKGTFKTSPRDPNLRSDGGQ